MKEENQFRREELFITLPGPQGFGIANMADALYAIRKLVYEERKLQWKS